MSQGFNDKAAAGYGDGLLSLLGLAGAALSIALLLSAHAPGPRGGEESEAIARVSFASAGVRRRPVGSLSWDDLSRGAVVRDRDSVFVPPGVEAQVTFGDGSRLDIDENSLVVLEAPAAARPHVELKKGSVSGATKAGGLEIATGGGRTALAGNTEARVDLRGLSARVEVYSGQASVAAAHGKEVLASHQARDMGPDGQVALLPTLSVQLDEPSRNQRLFFQGKPGPLALRWTGDLPAQANVQVARDRGFGFRVRDAAAAGVEARFDAASAGIYWWRLADGSGAALSEARRFTFIEDLPPAPLSPQPQEIVWVVGGNLLPFAWTEVAGAAAYQLEVATDPQFQHPAFTGTAAQPRLAMNRELPEADYYWRVRVSDAERGESPYSRTTAFRLIHKALPGAPELLNPEIEVEPAPEPK